MISGRFDGPSLILTLSAVKLLGKDNNGQFYDYLGGHRGCFLSTSCLILQNSPKEECSLPQTTQESSQPTCSLNNGSQVAF